MPDPKPAAAKKPQTQYRVYHQDDQGILSPIATVGAANPKDAIKSLANNLAPGAPQTFLAFADSAVTEVTVTIETKTEVVFNDA